MALADLWAIEMLIAAFAGGAFGAALGALPAFIFTGFMVIAGEAAVVANVDAGSITGSVAFGAPFSPAISFAGGAAAAAYAAGLAVGYWSDLEELRDNWQVDREFSPDGDAKDVEGRYGRWTEAVERSRDWAREN